VARCAVERNPLSDRRPKSRGPRRTLLAVAVTAVVAGGAGFGLGTRVEDDRADPAPARAADGGRAAKPRPAAFLLADDLVEPSIEARSGRTIPVVSEAFDGYVETARASGDRVAVSGWAVDEASKAPPSRILLFAGRRLLQVAEPTRERPDVVGETGTDAALLSGFRITVPRRDVGRGRRGAMRVFAIGGGRATELEHLR
jgi:hypothetical protein